MSPSNMVPLKAVLLNTKMLGIWVLQPTIRIAHLKPLCPAGIVTSEFDVFWMVKQPSFPRIFFAKLLMMLTPSFSFVAPRIKKVLKQRRLLSSRPTNLRNTVCIG